VPATKSTGVWQLPQARREGLFIQLSDLAPPLWHTAQFWMPAGNLIADQSNPVPASALWFTPAWIWWMNVGKSAPSAAMLGVGSVVLWQTTQASTMFRTPPWNRPPRRAMWHWLHAASVAIACWFATGVIVVPFVRKS